MTFNIPECWKREHLENALNRLEMIQPQSTKISRSNLQQGFQKVTAQSCSHGERFDKPKYIGGRKKKKKDGKRGLRAASMGIVGGCRGNLAVAQGWGQVIGAEED